MNKKKSYGQLSYRKKIQFQSFKERKGILKFINNMVENPETQTLVWETL